MGEEATLSRLSDKTVTRLLMIGKRHGLRPFFGHPKAMIALRDEAARRGIYYTKCEEVAVERDVYSRMYPETGDSRAKRTKRR